MLRRFRITTVRSKSWSATNEHQQNFERALDAFAQRISGLAGELHSELEKLAQSDAAFARAMQELHEYFREYNSAISAAAIEEFIVQHCLTIDLFRSIFGIADFESSTR